MPKLRGIPPAVRKPSIGIVAIGVAALLPLPIDPARAQLLDQLKGMTGSGHEGGGLPGLSGGLPSVDQASPGNTAGVLQYCVRNNYLSGAGASSAGNSIVSKMTGSGHTADDSGFKAGNSGMLQTGNGQGYSLGGTGVKAQVTHKVCDLVLQHAKSLL
jgi:Protein of unknown function (DUF2501)